MRKFCLSIALAVVVGVVLLSVLGNILGIAYLALNAPDPELIEPDPVFRRVLVKEGSESRRLARIDIEGMIFSSVAGPLGGSMVEQTKAMLADARSDDRVKGVLLYINSPGGEVTASDILYHHVGKLAAEKPVVIYMNSVAASGGYYIACAGHHIMANETTITGSIGVIMQSYNYRDAMEKIGLEAMTFTSGRYKDTLSPAREMREDEKVFIQGMVDGMYARFLGIVSKARGIPEDKLRDGIADGRVFSGSEAVDAGLVDRIGYLEDAYEDLARRAKTGGDASRIHYVGRGGFGGLLGFLGAAHAGAKREPKIDVKVDVLGDTRPPLQPGQAYYLPTAMAR